MGSPLPTLTIDFLPHMSVAVSVLVPSRAVLLTLHFGTAFVSNFMLAGKLTFVRVALGGCSG